MYLLILESIGTAELLLVGLVALIIFGPRKLPEMMRKAGKIMAEFRKTTGEFKESWEKEVALDFEEEKKLLLEEPEKAENTIGRNPEGRESENVLTPEIKEIDHKQFEMDFPLEETGKIEQGEEIKKEEKVKTIPDDKMDKRDWL